MVTSNYTEEAKRKLELFKKKLDNAADSATNEAASDADKSDSETSESDDFVNMGGAPPIDDAVDMHKSMDAIDAVLEMLGDTPDANDANNANNAWGTQDDSGWGTQDDSGWGDEQESTGDSGWDDEFTPQPAPRPNPIPQPAPKPKNPPVPKPITGDPEVLDWNCGTGGTNNTEDYYINQIEDFKRKSEPHYYQEIPYDRESALYYVNTVKKILHNSPPNDVESFINKIAEFREYYSAAMQEVAKFKTKVSRVRTLKQLEAVKKSLVTVVDYKRNFSRQNTTLQCMLNDYNAIPQYMSKLLAMLPTCKDADARNAIDYYSNGTILTYQGGAVGMLRAAHTKYIDLLRDWNNFDSMINECNNQVEAAEYHIREEQTVKQEISEDAQENAKTAFNQYGDGSPMGVFISNRELEHILQSAINEYTGGNYSSIQEFGITDDGDIILNDKLFDIANHIDLSSDDAMKIPQVYREQIQSGKWGCIFNFKYLTRFSNLRVLDLSAAPSRKIDALRDLGVNKGNWLTLFRRKSKFPMLQEIRLPEPEGVLTRESKYQRFKSNAEYEQYTAENMRQSQTIDEHNRQALGEMGADVKDTLSRGMETFKSAIWSKPLPRTLIKTFGYGVGIPMYWGLMTALGPVGVVMGALGIGAMARYEYKQLKSEG